MERFLTLPALAQCSGVNHLFGTRWVESPETVARYLEVAKERVVTVHQVHGDAIRIVEADYIGGATIPPNKVDSCEMRVVSGIFTTHNTQLSTLNCHSGYDALITLQPGLLLVIATADCVPILILDKAQKVIAAVHAGWRGLLKGIVAKVVATLRGRFGSHPRDLWVGLGPSAGACCYEVNGTVLEPLRRGFSEWRSVIRERQNGKALLDLHSFSRLQLLETGVPGQQVHTLDDCTICSPDRFYSYRRGGRKAGSMFSGIVVREP